MNLFAYLIPFVVALGVLIVFHELGHYLVARRCGVKVLRFSVGFGKTLLRWRAPGGETEWVLAAFPLGGYVKMVDEREGDVAERDLPRAFNRQPVGRRFAIVVAGPLANFLLAIVIYWALFVLGSMEIVPRLGTVDPHSQAALAGLQNGDRIVAVDDEPVQSWQDLRWVVLRRAVDAHTIRLQIEREGSTRFERALDLSGVRFDDARNDVLRQLGLQLWQPDIPPVVGKLVQGGPADRAGLQEGDRIVRIGDEPIPDWRDLVATVREAADEPLAFAIVRQGRELTLTITPEGVDEHGERRGRIGVAAAELPAGTPTLFAQVRYGPLDGLWRAVRQTWETSALTLSMMGKMIVGDVSWDNLSGPVTIANFAGQSAQLGLGHYLKFLALVSISLGVLNLLPIPVLDGGHLLYYMIEMIKGSPLSERVMEIGQQIGLSLLLMLMAFAFYNDINRLISG